MLIKEVPQCADLEEEDPTETGKAAKWFLILPVPARGIIHMSASDCAGLSDKSVSAALQYEFARAYQTTRTPFDADLINRAGTELPSRWNRNGNESIPHRKET
jgi:hypothetical protein